MFEKTHSSKYHILNEIKSEFKNEFYANCNAYFNALRKKGKTDYGFEDEYYYTMPIISGNTQ